MPVLCAPSEISTTPDHGLPLFKSDLDANTLIYSSDFARARQTAELARELLGAPDVQLTHNLRERSFGELEGRILPARVRGYRPEHLDELSDGQAWTERLGQAPPLPPLVRLRSDRSSPSSIILF